MKPSIHFPAIMAAACLAFAPAVQSATINNSQQFFENWTTPASTDPADFGWTVVNPLASPPTPTVSTQSYFGQTNAPMLETKSRGTAQAVRTERSDLIVDSFDNEWTLTLDFRVDKNNTENFSTVIFLSQEINQNWPSVGSPPGVWYEIFGSSATTFTFRSYGPAAWTTISAGLNTNTDYRLISVINGFTDTQSIEIRLVSDNSFVAGNSSAGVWGNINPANPMRSIGFISQAGQPTTGGNTFIDNIHVYGIPEPSSALLVLVGLGYFAARKRFRGGNRI